MEWVMVGPLVNLLHRRLQGNPLAAAAKDIKCLMDSVPKAPETFVTASGAGRKLARISISNFQISGFPVPKLVLDLLSLDF